MAKRLELMVMTGDLAGRRFAVGEKGLRLGRASSNDLFIVDEELSRNHCLFEVDGPDGIRVLDLASANGTFVNQEPLGADPKSLRLGDFIEVGATKLRVVGEGEAVTPLAVPSTAPVVVPSGAVDLGLGQSLAATTTEATDATAAPTTKRSFLASVLWCVVAVSVLTAIVIVLFLPKPASKPSVSAARSIAQEGELVSLSYEKVEADATRIFRYEMTVDSKGKLRVRYDDVPEADRHVDKETKLSARALERINEIIETKGLDDLEDVYSGPRASDENALKSWRLRIVRTTHVREILVENMPEPENFKNVREALETFSRNELGIWAIQYSREQLLSLSEESMERGDAKWSERDVEYGNLSAAIDLYKEAIYYLETVNPKPEGYGELKAMLDRAMKELDERYKNQRFLADKAINLADWETARNELRILCDLVPNKNDPRHDEANAKLVDVESRMKKMKKGNH